MVFLLLFNAVIMLFFTFIINGSWVGKLFARLLTISLCLANLIQAGMMSGYILHVK